jgi:excisionase family DNA binding protein
MNLNDSHSGAKAPSLSTSEVPSRILPDVQQTFTEPEAACYLKVSRQTLQRIRLRGEISFCRVGGTRVLYTFKHLEEYLTSRERKSFRDN